MPALAVDSAQYARIALVVAFYFVTSLSLVFLNKILFSGAESVPAPLFVTWYQCLVSVFCSWVLGKLGRVKPALKSVFPEFEFDYSRAARVLPVSLVFLGMVTFNNMCLQYVEVHFYQVARSLTILFNIALTKMLLGQSTSNKAVACCVVVVFGFALGSLGEVEFSMLGTLFGVLSSCFVALYSIYVKKTMPAVDNDSWKLSMYNNTNAVLLFLPLILLKGELAVVLTAPPVSTTMFWIVMTVTGVFGFLIGIATFLQIQHTSPLTHNISGTAKACVQSALSVPLFGSKITAMGAAGIGLVVLGTFQYTQVRRAEMEAASSAAAAPRAVTLSPQRRSSSAV